MAPRRYHVTTFGCQMNEADSEQIAAVLEADGLVHAGSVDDADVIVLNTCCIRENADNKLYGTLGHLKSLKAARPGVEIVVGGCLAQKDRERVRERAPHVDVVLGTHNVGRVADLLAESRRSGPVTEILDAVSEDHDEFPSALIARREVGFSSWLTIQVGCDNSCAFCIVPAVRGPEASRPFGQLVAEVERLAADGVSEITLLGQNVNSYGRDLTLRLRAHGSEADETPGSATSGTGRFDGIPSMLTMLVNRNGSASASWIISAPPLEWPIAGTGLRPTVASNTAEASRRSASHE